MIEINNLSFAYKKQASLFHNLSINEDDGQIIGLLGKNGAGKTTLLQLISGLLSPKDGQISVNNYRPEQRHPAFLEQLYFVPEEFIMPSVKVMDFVEAMSPFYHRFDTTLLHDLLKKFELDLNKTLSKMSHGQKKKFRIAFALATKCQVIILDEPTNGLDIPSKVIFRQIVAGSLEDDQTVIISTHQVKDVETLIDKILLVDNGQVIFNKSIIDISEKYDFKIVSHLPSDAIYSELNPMGYKIVTQTNGMSSEVDIELLFNAINNGITFN
ncbi:ATP-binding cassette domain-containing protein [Carboxylicivirga sp. M1479]|uniref:ABC transporter ATP-binding protein n=1 Tax=Carboxylicivirga sp. M1479 TaxID=2594476 RepID=UPI0011789E20|nr:ABC transporter ATP-binding protein [Carboxylicivirga sp. M1479]TRX71702.1 ABC transporter ATP-binding protein [Carboxylicivirga sp. M1479]